MVYTYFIVVGGREANEDEMEVETEEEEPPATLLTSVGVGGRGGRGGRGVGRSGRG